VNFLEKALLTTTKGVPVIRLRPNSKAAMDSGWPQLATTDIEIIKKWNEESPDSNCGAVASLDGIWFWETDSSNVAERVFRETGNNLNDIKTFKVRSRVGRGHFYFKQNNASRAMGNIAQTYVLEQDWSARVQGAYVVSNGSIHPDTGVPYAAINDNTIIEAPQWLIDWLFSQKIQKLSAPSGNDPVRNSNGKIPHGGIHNWMLTQAGRLRNIGLTQEEIERVLLDIVHRECEPPIDDNKVKAMAKSICIYEPGENRGLILNQSTAPEAVFEPEEEPDIEDAEYPVFPRWIMEGTSIYENFVRPVCEKSSRLPEFMWMPTMVLAMNYLGTKVNVWGKTWMPSFYLTVIGEKGKSNKSSSIGDAMKYLEYISILQHASRDTKNADGKSLIWTAGSPEGLGIEMQRTACKNSILYYDELSGLVAKARIEGSGMNDAMLKMYESGKFGNTIKAKKDTFSVEPGTYCASIITATTAKKFVELWSQLAGEDTGLDDRFFFLLQPETLPQTKLQQFVNTNDGALKTRQMIDRAVEKKTFNFFDQTPLQAIAEKYGNRTEIRTEKFALYFAIDLGLDEIDEDCVERAIALTKYEIEVKKYLMTFEAKNDESAIQQGIMRLLKRNKGRMLARELERSMRSPRFGTSLWKKAYFGLVGAEYICEEGKGCKGDPRVTRIIRNMKMGDDD
jgi:hypothetical protein